ncbi:protein TIME FOR COFFEE-like isoform X2 [Actinidia eriantha]|uniref:protein TIME FOR COFFEE-like isoform X2 n=1 Tax=Actinidia eriantha TaxID=165200 RepID=UPI0025854CB6|nr:protein TIME FOR COFFEE-like isoform X2 [Actinidia eriantha]
MDRNREARRASMVATANVLPRRRHRSNSLRDSPEEDGLVEMHESTRLRDRGVKKDRDRDRSSRSKRRRGDRLIHGSNREDGGEDSSEESVNDEEEDDCDDDGGGGGGAVRMLPPNPLISSSLSNQQQQRKSFPPSGADKVFRTVQGWKPADGLNCFSVPRKARSASTKRSHECLVSGGGLTGEQIHRQASTSPVRPSLASTSTPSPAPVSPSSSNVSVRKKLKLNGSKPRPPKSSSKSSSSNPEELEIEIAEVLYGLMTQTQGPSKKEITANDSAKFDPRELNKSSSDAKSRISSPFSNSNSTAPQSTSVLTQNSSPSPTPVSAVAPKRKRPRQASDNLGGFSVRNSSISSTTVTMKTEIDQPPKTEFSSPNSEKNTGSAAENGTVPHDFDSSQVVLPSPEPPPPESCRPETGCAFSECKAVKEESGESRDLGQAKEAAVASPKKESPAVRPEGDCEDETATKENSKISEIEIHLEEKFQIDLMAPPPQMRSSPEREGEINFAEHKPTVPGGDAAEMRSNHKEEEKAVNVEPELKKAKATAEEAKPEKPLVRNIDLQLDSDKPERDSTINGNKLHPHVQKQQQMKATRDEQPLHTDKTAQSSSFPLPMSVASWPSGLPPMGYMAPLQGVVSMDGSPVPSTTIQPLFSQPRPKRCATHCYIARNIHCLQQLVKMNPFWPTAASGSLFGAKPCNLNVVPAAELQGSIAGRNANPVQDKGQSQGLSIFPGHSPGHSGKDKGSQASNISDSQRKQPILLQQGLAPGAPPSNLLHGPAFIFPLNQQLPPASVRPGSVKSTAAEGNVAPTSASNSSSANGSANTHPAAVAAAAMSFNYPNMPASEAQYLAILQNNAYPFPIPSVGAPPTHKGTPAPAMPFFNGSFYSSQMIHPLQLQQQQQQSNQPQHMQQGHQNTSMSSGSSSSHKHLQSQQQRLQGSSANGDNRNGNLHNFPAPKDRPSQASSQQQQPNRHMPTTHQGRLLETEAGGEDSPSPADSRVSRATMNVYGQNFAIPIHHHNFGLMTTPPALAGATGGGGNQGEKKHLQQLQQGSKSGAESLPPQTFAMSFTSFNDAASTAPGIDMAQNHSKHNYQIMAAAVASQATQQKKNFRVSEEGKPRGGDPSSVDEERKGLAGKAPPSQTTFGQSIVFSRPDLIDTPVSTISSTTVIDSSARSLNLVSAPPRTSRSAMSNLMGTASNPNSQLQAQLQFQQQQMMQFQKQQQQLQLQQQQVMAARNKTPPASTGSIYSDHLSSSSPSAAKFSSPLSAFPQNLVQSNSSSSPAQSPQWKNSTRTNSQGQVPPSLASSTASPLKNFPQQQARTQPSHTQISFGGSQKSSAPPQGQQASNTHQSPSPPMVVGSPTTSSFSRGASGSPRTTTTSSQCNKATQPSTLSSHQPRNSASIPSRKSSPVGGRNVTSMLGNPHITSLSTGAKPQMQQQQQQQQQQHQQQLSKQNVNQPQLFFTPAYLQPHSTSSSPTASATSGYYLQRRRPDQQQQSLQPQGSSASTSSTGMLSLCPPVSLASATTSDAKAVAAAAAAAASNMKGGGLPSHSILLPAQFTTPSSGGFSYGHAVPAAVQVKPAEQKQPAGNRDCLIIA